MQALEQVDSERLQAFREKLQQYTFLEEREQFEGSLSEFVRGAWPSIDSSEYQPSWAIDAICDHLEAVSLGQIRRLLINVPPRCSKTTVASICWPAWTWAQPASMKSFWMGPHVKFLCGSYSNTLSLLSSNTQRRLILSPWFQNYWGERFFLTEDQNTKNRFDTTKGGTRQATSVGGSLLGLGGDIIICLPYGERVLTDKGWLPIGEIVEGSLKVEVAGWDHDSSELCWQKIEKYEKNPGKELIEIQWGTGSIRCTEDHPVYIEGKGYTAAEEVREGDVVWTIEEHDLQGVRGKLYSESFSTPDLLHNGLQIDYSKGCEAGKENEPPLQSLWCALFTERSSVGLPRKESPLRTILQQSLLAKVFQWVGESSVAGRGCGEVLRWLWEVVLSSSGEQSNYVLATMPSYSSLAKSKKASSRKILYCLWEEFFDSLLSKTKMLFELLSMGASVSNTVEEASFPQHISSGLEQRPKKDNTDKGWRSLFGLWRGLARRTADQSRSPHRLHASQSRSYEPSHPLPELPRTGACKRGTGLLGRKVVTNVARKGWAENTYNLCVSPTHNYFAEGALLHNCDDPHNTETEKKVETDSDRLKVASWWRELSGTRLNSPKNSSIVVVMQRLHEGDLSGVILDGEDDFVHLMIPMRHDPARHNVTVILPQYDDEEPWEDPRTEEDELMWPERFGEAEVARLERQLGPYMASGRLQQAPSPKGGGIIKRDWWQNWGPEEARIYNLEWSPGRKEFPIFELVIGSLDTSYGEKQENDYNALTVWGIWQDRNKNRRAMLMYAWRKRLPLHGKLLVQIPGETVVAFQQRQREAFGLTEWVADTCKRYKVRRLLIEDKTRGRDVANEINRLYARENWAPHLVIPAGDKVSRTHSVVPLFTDGAVWAPDTRWADLVITECQSFPKGNHDDLHDSVTQFLNFARETGILVLAEEAAAELEAESALKPPVQSVASQYGVGGR